MELVNLVASRNMISFSNINDVDISICSEELIKVLKYIKQLVFNSDVDISTKDNIEIRANELNWSLRVITKNVKIIENIKQYILSDKEDTKYCKRCVYLEINKIIFRDERFIDEYIYGLSYNPLSFRQPDNTIRSWLINFFKKEYFGDGSILCIGGECTLFGKILNVQNKYFITDFASIYNDLQINYPDNTNILLVDYKTCKLDINSRNIIVNTGYNGMGKNLANELIKSSRIFRIYIVSCNETSFEADYSILKWKFIVIRKIEIRTNYAVWLYILDYYNIDSIKKCLMFK